MTKQELAKELQIGSATLYRYFKEGMPADFDGARAWLTAKQTGGPAPKIIPRTTVNQDKTLSDTIDEHRARVAQAREIWGTAMNQGDKDQGKFQTQYNHSLKTLIALEEEAERRALMARDYIRSSEASAAMNELTGRIMARLEKMPAEVCEECNPKSPAVVIAVLSEFVRKMREDLSA